MRRTTAVGGGLLSLQRLFFFQAEDGIRDYKVTGVQTCALPISKLLDAANSAASSSFARDCTRDHHRTERFGLRQRERAAFGELEEGDKRRQQDRKSVV